MGAWDYGYLRLGWKPTDDRAAKALVDFKQALIDNGYGLNIDVTQKVFGQAATNRTKEFQKARGIGADGVLGPHTARLLWEHYIFPFEDQYGIPEHWLARIAVGESAGDPVARGVSDPDDYGLLQFHLSYWPGTTVDEAYTPTYEIRLAAAKLKNYRDYTGSWKGAVVAWNIGETYARDWVQANYPPSGGPSLGTDPNGNPIDSFERATTYLAYIAGLPY